MGLAPHGDPKYTDITLDNLLDLKKDGFFRLNMVYFGYGAGLKMTNTRFETLFGGPAREPETATRVQTVEDGDNPLLHRLLVAFYQRTGCSVLINTSFNVRGEPPVCSPEDAFLCFMGTKIDYLAIGSFLLDKTKQKPAGKNTARHEVFGPISCSRADFLRHHNSDGNLHEIFRPRSSRKATPASSRLILAQKREKNPASLQLRAAILVEGFTMELSLVKEIWDFLKLKKKWWPAPIIFLLLVLNLIITFAQSSPVAPFIYTLF